MSPDDDLPITPDQVVHGHGLADDPLDGPHTPSSSGEDPLAALLGGGDSGLDFGALMEQASNLQAQLLAAQAEAADSVVEGVAGGGAVRIEVTGGHQFRAVTIAREAVDPDDVEMLQDLVLAALHDAAERIDELQAGSVDLKGLGLDGLFGGGS